MGLCKCPKRKVTNLFCYEHRVNVCEHCIVSNHSTCIILSYLKWLQDGEYNPICELCRCSLGKEDCIRLICYHVFHWSCLDKFARELPATTAPAGYKCPSCNTCIFPAANLVSPIADVLREKLCNVNWARAGLGLPLLAEEQEQYPETQGPPIQHDYRPAQLQFYVEQDPTDADNSRSGDITVNIDELNDPFDSQKFPDVIPRRIPHLVERQPRVEVKDHDENKYERRTISERISRWHVCARNSNYCKFYFKSKYRRCILLFALLFLGFFVLMLFSDHLRDSSEVEIDDPNFDPMFNPNIRVKE